MMTGRQKKGVREVLAILLVLCLASCSPRVIERVVVQHDTTRVVVRDSVWQYQRDSVFLQERGDTVYKYVEHIRYRDRVKVDTFYRVKVDTVAVEAIKEVEVTQPLTWWQKTRQQAFWPLLLACLALLIWTFRKYIIKLFVK